MMLNERIESLVYLGKFLDRQTDDFEVVKKKAEIENPWFTQESIDEAIEGIKLWLTKSELETWIENYDIKDKKSKRVGLILAGNIPLVGFHDILVCYVSGNISVIRFSEKDQVLIKYLLNELINAFPNADAYFDFDENFKTIDTLIATGSDSTANLFQRYFSQIPSLIRCHRNAVAVLHGNENDEELLALGKDAFSYFGLGCRNISKLFVPQGYTFDHLLGLWHENFKEMVLHTKYKNNFDYLYAIYLLNQEPFFANGQVILKESSELSSPVASLHYEYYDNLDQVSQNLMALSNRLQVIISKIPLDGLECVAPGKAQRPGISDYADGVDTMQFLLN